LQGLIYAVSDVSATLQYLVTLFQTNLALSITILSDNNNKMTFTVMYICTYNLWKRDQHFS